MSAGLTFIIIGTESIEPVGFVANEMVFEQLKVMFATPGQGLIGQIHTILFGFGFARVTTLKGFT